MSVFPKMDPPAVELTTLRTGDPRVGHLIASRLSASDKPVVSILGFPFDEGVRINGGRVGAALAPAVIRKCLYRLTPDSRDALSFSDLIAKTKDHGDIVAKKDLSAAQAALAEAVAAVLQSGGVPIVLGGGHETTLGHFLGYVAAKCPVHIINLDAHPDVRERISGQSHSGSSFRDAMEHSSHLCRGYSVFGLQPHSCAYSHVEYLSGNKSEFVWAEDVSKEKINRLFSELRQDALVSIDVDVVDQAFAPGVSAPATGGLLPSMLLDFAFQAGRCSFVRSFDIVEANPTIDRDDQTCRLAALTVWHFLRGVSCRAKEGLKALR